MTATEATDGIVVDTLDANFCEEVASLPGGEHIRKCFACGTCAAGCPVTDVDEEYNPRKIVRQVLFGMRDEVLSSPLIWFCQICYRCYARCPQGVNFTDVMRVLRFLAIKGGHVPPEMRAKAEEVDRFAQKLRRDMMKETVEGRKDLMEELKARIAKGQEKKP